LRLTKRVYQVYTVDSANSTVLARPMSPERSLSWSVRLPADSVVAVGSCSSAHHLARRLRLMGLDARLIAAHVIAPFRVHGARGQIDANEAKLGIRVSGGLLVPSLRLVAACKAVCGCSVCSSSRCRCLEHWSRNGKTSKGQVLLLEPETVGNLCSRTGSQT
jgi:hypothetical protein